MHAEARAIEVAGWQRGRGGRRTREPLSEFQMALEVAVLSLALFFFFNFFFYFKGKK